MAKKEKDPNKPKAAKGIRNYAPEIIEARQKCAIVRDSIKSECKKIMAQARQAAAVRRLTESMTPEQREALRESLNESSPA